MGCQHGESCCGASVPAQAAWLRVLLLQHALAPLFSGPHNPQNRSPTARCRAEELRRKATTGQEGAGQAGISGTAAAFAEGADAEPHQVCRGRAGLLASGCVLQLRLEAGCVQQTGHSEQTQTHSACACTAGHGVHSGNAGGGSGSRAGHVSAVFGREALRRLAMCCALSVATCTACCWCLDKLPTTCLPHITAAAGAPRPRRCRQRWQMQQATCRRHPAAGSCQPKHGGPWRWPAAGGQSSPNARRWSKPLAPCWSSSLRVHGHGPDSSPRCRPKPSPVLKHCFCPLNPLLPSAVPLPRYPLPCSRRFAFTTDTPNQLDSYTLCIHGETAIPNPLRALCREKHSRAEVPLNQLATQPANEGSSTTTTSSTRSAGMPACRSRWH